MKFIGENEVRNQIKGKKICDSELTNEKETAVFDLEWRSLQLCERMSEWALETLATRNSKQDT